MNKKFHNVKKQKRKKVITKNKYKKVKENKQKMSPKEQIDISKTVFHFKNKMQIKQIQKINRIQQRISR